MVLRQGEHGEALGQVLLCPVRKLGLILTPGSDEFLEPLLRVSFVVGVEYGADAGGDLAFEVLFGDVVLGVLLEVELAALPWTGIERGFEGGPETCMRIGCNHVGNANAAFLEAGQELPPMNLRLGESAGDAENHAFAVIASHADCFQGGAIPYSAIDADLVVGGVE